MALADSSSHGSLEVTLPMITAFSREAQKWEVRSAHTMWALLMMHQPHLHQPWRLDRCNPFIHSWVTQMCPQTCA